MKNNEVIAETISEHSGVPKGRQRGQVPPQGPDKKRTLNLSVENGRLTS